MTFPDLFRETYAAITANKVRSGLTMLGIIIGIGSVIAMVSIGQGAQASIEKSIQSIGSNLLIVIPGAQRTPGRQVSAGRGSAVSLTKADADAIDKEISLAQAVAPEISSRYQISARGNNTNTVVVGTVPEYTTVRNLEIEEGSFFTAQNLKSLAKVAVIGPTTRDDLFGENADPLGQTLRIKGLNFKVIGVTKSKGGAGFTNQDDVIYIPVTTAHHFLLGDTYLTTISIQAPNPESLTTLQESINSLLLRRHKIKDPTLADFSIFNQADIVATASTVTGVFTLLLGAIASISLLVGGIGIMNMMLTTVTERTREIGLRKAIGAKKRDIGRQFLAESIMITFFGGGIGIALGWLIAFGFGSLINIPSEVSLSSILLAFGVSATIGIIFGYYPARRAANLNPIEALRYE